MQGFRETGRWTNRTYLHKQDCGDYHREIRAVIDPIDGCCRGGLCDSYVLQDMFPTVMIHVLKEQGYTIPFVVPLGPRRWQRSPLTTIICSMVIMGTLSNRLRNAEVQILRRLQDLYSRDRSEHDSATSEE